MKRQDAFDKMRANRSKAERIKAADHRSAMAIKAFLRYTETIEEEGRKRIDEIARKAYPIHFF